MSELLASGSAASGVELASAWLTGAGVFVAVVTLGIAIAAFQYARRQLQTAKAQARKDRLDDLVQRMTSREATIAFIEADKILKICESAGPSRRREMWDGLKALSPERRLQRAQVLYVINIVEELAKDCEKGDVDPKIAKIEFGDAVALLWEKWAWLVESYHDEDRIAGITEADRGWHYFAIKGRKWSAER